MNTRRIKNGNNFVRKECDKKEKLGIRGRGRGLCFNPQSVAAGVRIQGSVPMPGPRGGSLGPNDAPPPQGSTPPHNSTRSNSLDLSYRVCPLPPIQPLHIIRPFEVWKLHQCVELGGGVMAFTPLREFGGAQLDKFKRRGQHPTGATQWVQKRKPTSPTVQTTVRRKSNAMWSNGAKIHLGSLSASKDRGQFPLGGQPTGVGVAWCPPGLWLWHRKKEYARRWLAFCGTNVYEYYY